MATLAAAQAQLRQASSSSATAATTTSSKKRARSDTEGSSQASVASQARVAAGSEAERRGGGGGGAAAAAPSTSTNPHVDDDDATLATDLSSCGLPPSLAPALSTGLGVERLFPMQVASLRAALDPATTHRDVCLSAPTGSGKTLVYALMVLHALHLLSLIHI